ncbi:NAD(+) diphosphatase [Robbsia andropogonis]|uniref:NAD(+) diphosphatase n=1 Tax=Robbsia andropogonis TaxID=28092 RepID=UPI00209CA586|nr:NAD(+) diphosphatase [Robbsia andropogonis]MCP1117576.1 NAD(+) diphosphatase [Robbsia andropogonis]MCP1127042.1 NAD(+) diphosphatase [Robbsia andropogonis]
MSDTSAKTPAPDLAPRVATHDIWHDPVVALETGFTGNTLDRCSERRDDLVFISALRRDPRARIVLFAADAPLVWTGTHVPVDEASPPCSATAPETVSVQTIHLENGVGITSADVIASGDMTAGTPYALHETVVRILSNAGFGTAARDHANADEESVLLGIDSNGVPWFAQRADVATTDIESQEIRPRPVTFPETVLTWPVREVLVTSPGLPITPQSASDVAAANDTLTVRAVGLRALATQGALPSVELAMIAQAKAVLEWHVRHRFCARCGSASRVAAAGWRRECPTCAALHFPRVDPVVIMIVIDRSSPEAPRCLLGRQLQFAPGMYSALAGFLEPGETIEDAVRREVREEAGVQCGTVRYLKSQPWPFPGSLMLGCAAVATSTTLRIDHNELEDAGWFNREEVRDMLAGTHPRQLKTPQPHAIAATLIRAFVDGLLD